MIYFTSDTHFGHRRIIEYCGRPFATVEAMDEALIANWNATVRPQDVVYHLGDFSLEKREGPARTFARLSGRKHLILGNHDDVDAMSSLGWESVERYRRISAEGVDFILFHYPLVAWERSSRNLGDTVRSVDLFGHVHGTHADPKHAFSPYQHDVGVDLNGFRPVSSTEVVAIVQSRLDPGRHGR